MSHDGEDYTQIAFLRSDIDDSTGEYTERFEAGSFDMPAADALRFDLAVDLMDYFSGRTFEGEPGVSRGLEPREAVAAVEGATGCDLNFFEDFWLGSPGEIVESVHVGPYTKQSLLDFSYYAKELSRRYGFADSDILEIARHLPEECPDRFAAVKAYLDCEYVPDGDAPDEKTYRWGDFLEIAGGDARYAAMLVDRTAAGESEEGLHPETLVDQDIRDGEAFMLAGRPIAPEDAYDLPGTVLGLYKELADNVDRSGMLFRDWRGFAAGTDADDVLRAIEAAFGETEYSRAGTVLGAYADDTFMSPLHVAQDAPRDVTPLTPWEDEDGVAFLSRTLDADAGAPVPCLWYCMRDGEQGYEAARERARKAGKCFICASHYPAEDCLGRIDRDAVYFSGHTHQNRYLRSENAVIYADNQVGYHKRGGFDPRWDMRFKRATTGCARNPYADLADGCYPTTADEYLSFYRFIGEYAGTGKMIRQRCEKNDMHVIKSNGYYGFFLVGENGTSIVNGGKTKRVSTHRDIKWAHDNFDTVVSKYLAALAPLRERQEQVSGELKRLGFSGNIHGLIVDVNFSHHIMVNPADGSLVFYYSPEYGWVGTFDSFPKLLEHVKDSEQLHIDMNPLYALQAGDTPTRCDVALERYDAGVLAPSPSMALAPASIEGVEVLEKSEGRDLDRLVNVDLEHGAYKLSRDVAPLQRLFSKHVLRNFDARLAELDDGSAARRTKSMAGRVFKDEFGMMWLIVGDDLGEFVDALDQDGKERRVTVLALRKLVATQGDGRWLTKSLDETESAFKGRYQPKAWRGALPSLRLRDLSAGE